MEARDVAGYETTIFTTAYDARTRRLGKTEGAASTIFRYDGGTNFQERNTSGQTITELVRAGGLGGGIGSILYSDKTMAPTPGEWEGFLYNAIGSTTLVTDSTGTPTQRNLYEAFGETVIQDGESENNRLRNTKERDASIGLDNDGFRYYDPSSGRYVQRDPIGYGDGLNVYAHVTNNPVNNVDPLGLETLSRGDSIAQARDNLRNRPMSAGQILFPTLHGGPNIPDGYSEFHQSAVLPMIEPGARAMEGAAKVAVVVADTVRPAPDDMWTGARAVYAGFGQGLSPKQRSILIGGGLLTAVFGALDVVDWVPDPSDGVQKAVREGVKATLESAGKQAANLAQNGTKAAPTPIVKEGIYEFPDQIAGDVPYVGQSANVPRRLDAHEAAGRYVPGTETTTEVLGGTTAREVAEHRKIQEHTGGVPARESPAVANKKDPIGPKRQHLLDDKK